MAAEQAAGMADRNVVVLQTKSVPEGMSAMLAYDPDINFEESVCEIAF